MVTHTHTHTHTHTNTQSEIWVPARIKWHLTEPCPKKFNSTIKRSELIHRNVRQTPIQINMEYLISFFLNLTFLTNVKHLPYRYNYKIFQPCWCFFALFFFFEAIEMSWKAQPITEISFWHRRKKIYYDSIHVMLTFSYKLFNFAIHQ